MIYATVPWLSPVAKAACILCYFAVWFACYTRTNDLGSQPGRAIQLHRPIDRMPELNQPWTAVIYVLVGFLLPVLPFYYHWTWPRLGFVLACYATASAVALICYWLWPVSIVRQSFDGSGVGEWLMRQVLSVDRSANCTPSSHVIYASLAALLMSRGGASRPAIFATWMAAGAVSLTTVTTGQHYWLDIVSGMAIALISYKYLARFGPSRTFRPV
jgi:membrane-associated phospholipid phosphatase